ncbi:MAG: hypothetical protein HOM68_03400 [Gemmatimonadetes bacterium]|jgi:predicted Holliday junction resolvase-like endonuclease|nr:hypothetical protein [Gemmatimonadota bacterium]MBT5055566.1 hypothetical protein [Gemmatimonadota bacterium]MBT5143914.1 hypothetical protein [Gemmatimonadota bacterium]MBT5588647.1 hypothetical protein [Gemmatimonadota bacterium]MBT5962515.1 hypothetical protein [Gemmatimonadota bacterium]
MGVEHIFLASLLLAIPISARYVTAFQLRTLQDQLHHREREIETMLAHLKGLRHEELITRRASHQVTKQQRWAGTRRQIMAMELERVRRPVAVTETEAAESGFEPEIPPEWTPEGLRPSVGAPDADYASTVAAQA